MDKVPQALGAGLLWRFAIRGGNWNNGANAGLFNLLLNHARTGSNNSVGFRSDFVTGGRLRLAGLDPVQNKGESRSLSRLVEAAYKKGPRFGPAKYMNRWGSISSPAANIEPR